jgi:hypothetical protein
MQIAFQVLKFNFHLHKNINMGIRLAKVVIATLYSEYFISSS